MNMLKVYFVCDPQNCYVGCRSCHCCVCCIIISQSYFQVQIPFLDVQGDRSRSCIFSYSFLRGLVVLDYSHPNTAPGNRERQSWKNTFVPHR